MGYVRITASLIAAKHMLYLLLTSTSDLLQSFTGWFENGAMIMAAAVHTMRDVAKVDDVLLVGITAIFAMTYAEVKHFISECRTKTA